MIGKALGTLWSWIVLIVGLVIIFWAIGWFIDNSALAGSKVGSFITAIQTFFTSLLSSSPLG